MERIITKNTNEADARGKELEETFGKTNNGSNRAILKLWEELLDDPAHRYCVYSGEIISPTMLFNGEVDIDHILPFSKTLDDSFANKILCTREANRQKRNHAPADVIEWAERYSEIKARAARLPKNKRWRFGPDAMERFRDENGFLSRHLNDTQYLSRLAREYLEVLYPTEESDDFCELRYRKHVNVTPGKLTEMLRRKWGLNNLLHDADFADTGKEKNRLDHRHHAIDAAIIAVTSVSMLQNISRLAGLHERGELNKLIDGEKLLPWPRFRGDLQTVISDIIVSHKPDHGTINREGYSVGKGKTAGRLHDDFAYDLTGVTSTSGKTIVVRRKAITGLEPEHIATIRDKELKDRLWAATRDLSGDEFKRAVLKFSQEDPVFRGIRRVRMVETLGVIPIKDAAGKPYKGYKGNSNYRYDVWALPNGTSESEVVSMFDAHQPTWESKIKREFLTAKKVLRLPKKDMVKYEDPQRGTFIAIVIKLGASGSIFLAPHYEAGDLKDRDGSKDDPLKYISRSASKLPKHKIHQIRVDEIGQVFDPGWLS